LIDTVLTDCLSLTVGRSFSGNERSSNDCPLLVHCGTGVSRTAVFIAVDYSLMKAKRDNCVNVYRFDSCVSPRRLFIGCINHCDCRL